MRSPSSEALPKRTALRRQHIRAATENRPPHGHRGTGAHRESPAPARLGSSTDLAGLTVVVVDDDRDSLDYFALALRTAGAVVMTASSASDALRLVRERHPHVVLSDIAMVGQDGYWLVREIRALADTAVKRVPVVATTAYRRDHSREKALSAGFNDHLSKPVDPDVLCRAIATAAGR